MTPNWYQVIRPGVQTGDVFAFSGRGFVSGGIRLFAGDPTHVATVDRIEEDGRIRLIESTTLTTPAGEVKGVQRNFASERIAAYDGTVRWLPINSEFRSRMDWQKWAQFLDSYAARQVPYDYRQCLRMMMAPLAHVPGLGFLRNHESLSKVYCSELIAASWVAGGALPLDYNCSDCSPRDLCSLAVYRTQVAVKGTMGVIKGFNSRPVPDSITGAAV